MRASARRRSPVVPRVSANHSAAFRVGLPVGRADRPHRFGALPAPISICRYHIAAQLPKDGPRGRRSSARSQSIARTGHGGRRLAVAAAASANSGRQERSSAVVSDVGAPMSTRTITPDEALELTAPTDGFLCPLSANVYGIDFLEFEIKDYDSGEAFSTCV